MSLFGAARLYVAGADPIERDLAPSDVGSGPLHRDGAWALWAQAGDSRREKDPPPKMSRVEPGPVRIVHRWSAPA
jgi:hypothetical protein